MSPLRRGLTHAFFWVWAPSAAASLISRQVLTVGRGGVWATNTLSGLLLWRPARIGLQQRWVFPRLGHRNLQKSALNCALTLFQAGSLKLGFNGGMGGTHWMQQIQKFSHRVDSIPTDRCFWNSPPHQPPGVSGTFSCGFRKDPDESALRFCLHCSYDSVSA